MPKATQTQLKAFGNALNDALRDRASTLPDGTRTDEWLGSQVDLSSQAIRNYVNGLREPNRQRVARIEDALELERHFLGRHLGIGVSDSERLDQLEARIDALNDLVKHLLRGVEPVPPATPPSAPPSPRAGQSDS